MFVPGHSSQKAATATATATQKGNRSKAAISQVRGIDRRLQGNQRGNRSNLRQQGDRGNIFLRIIYDFQNIYKHFIKCSQWKIK